MRFRRWLATRTRSTARASRLSGGSARESWAAESSMMLMGWRRSWATTEVHCSTWVRSCCSASWAAMSARTSSFLAVMSRVSPSQRPSGSCFVLTSTSTQLPSLRRICQSLVTVSPRRTASRSATRRGTSSGRMKSTMVLPMISSAA